MRKIFLYVYGMKSEISHVKNFTWHW